MALSIRKIYEERIYAYVEDRRGATRIANILEKLSGRYFVDSSIKYWEERYQERGNSGEGSYGELAEFKAEILNDFVEENDIETVIEFGCGDGNQLSLAKYPDYIGLDVSEEPIKTCKEKFGDDSSKSFFLYKPHCFRDNHDIFKADLAISLDVIFHLVEDEIFRKHIEHLFGSAQNYVVIYSSNEEINDTAPHVKHREFTDYIEKNVENWSLKENIENRYPEKSNSEFFIYKKEKS